MNARQLSFYLLVSVCFRRHLVIVDANFDVCFSQTRVSAMRQSVQETGQSEAPSAGGMLQNGTVFVHQMR